MFGKSQKSPSMKVPLVVTSLGSKLIFSASRHCFSNVSIEE